jgi:hypothetical protein
MTNTFPAGDSPPITEDPPVNDQQAQGNFWGYLLEEDNALKQKLSGVFVKSLTSDRQENRVWFTNPEKEQRGIRYPYTTIEFINQSMATDRMHSGFVSVGYKYLQDIPYPMAQVPRMEYPIPMDLDYRVITHARNNQHHQQLIAAYSAVDRLHPRFAYVLCSGGTIRRLEVLKSTPSIGLDKDDMRIFRMIYQIRIPTEIEPIVAMGTRVKHIVLQIVDTVSGSVLGGTSVPAN